MLTKQTFTDYIDIGWSVIPIFFKEDEKGKVQKKAMIKWAEFQKRFATEEEIESWVARKPQGLALITGELSKVVAIDVDDEEDPIELSSSIVVKSAFSGGRHYFYKWSEELRNTAKIEGMPVDFRGDGGYLVLPPSSHEGKSYEFLKRTHTMYLKQVPDNIKKMLESREAKAMSFQPGGEGNPYPEVSSGSRNDTASRVIGSLLARIDPKLWEMAAWGAFRQWNAEKCEPSLPEDELRATYESVKNRESVSRVEKDKPQKIPQPLSLKEVAIKRIEERALEATAPSTGYEELDELIRGFIPGHVYVTTGDTNVGKTTISCNFAHRVSKQGKKVLYFALEPENTVVDYLASIRSGKTFAQLNDSDILEEDDNIHVYGKESIRTIEDLSAVVKSLDRYDLIIIDHIGYFTSSSGGTTEKQANVMKQLAGIAKAKQSALVVIAHIRKRQNKSTQINEDDISGSGAFKQDATEVLILTRESELDSSGSEIYTDNGAILVRKTKSGRQGQVQITFQPGGADIKDSYNMAETLF